MIQSEADGKTTVIKMPWPHMQIKLIRPKETYFLANRGGFKTSLGMAPYVADTAYEFPKGSGVIVGPSFEHLYDNTVNALTKALVDIGFEEGKHFVVRIKPPEGWPQPFVQVSSKKYDNLITWHTGFTQHLISLARVGSSNALSVVSGCFDEAKLLDESALMDEVYPIFRSFKNMPEEWKKSSLFMSKFFASDKLESPNKINWLLEKREKNDPKRNELIISFQYALNDLLTEFNTSGKSRQAQIRPYIRELEEMLTFLRKDLSLYIEANHEDTQVIQGESWYSDKVGTMKPYELKVAIRNEDPTRPEHGYYPDFDTEVHGYRNINDYDPNKALIISADYQHSVSPIPIAQVSTLPGCDEDSLNYIDEVYTLAPEGLFKACIKAADRYAKHVKKRIYYIHDQTAIGKRNDATTYADTVKKAFKSKGWKVIMVYTGAAPGHGQKYNDTKKMLKNEEKKEMDIRVNLDKCKKLVISITAAEAYTDNDGKTRKQKKYENTIRYPKLNQAETTHFSDTFDMTNHGVIILKKIKRGSSGGGSLGFGR